MILVARTRSVEVRCVRWDNTHDAIDDIAELLGARRAQLHACSAQCWHLLRRSEILASWWMLTGGELKGITLRVAETGLLVPVPVGAFVGVDASTGFPWICDEDAFHERYEL